MSLRIVPAPSHASKLAPAGSNGAPSVRSVPDTLRNGLSSSNALVNSQHPLEARLKKWDETQEALKMEGLRRMFGAHEPIRRGMELRITGTDFKPLQLGGPSNLHLDILKNRDTTIEWEDVFKGTENIYELPDFHSEMEAKLRMNW
ncbi:hypothetical protein RUND412_004962 [Rhizina undulata]